VNNLLEQMQWRYAVKKYDPTRKLSAESIAQLQGAIQLAPSSHGLQPYSVLIVSDESTRTALRAASHDQPQITEASHLFVFAVDAHIGTTTVDAYFRHLCHERGANMEGRLLDHRNAVVASIERLSPDEKVAWATRQAYLALGVLLSAAAQLGIDANPMEGFMASRYDDLLELSRQGLRTVVIAGVGYRAPDDAFQHFKKVRKAADQLFIHR
jgi:nitroreductase/dihydropteridine reductase